MNQLLQLRKFLYSLGIVAPVKFPVPVISVGNLSMGGTGKSPLVARICAELSEQGRHVLLLSRGYGRVSNEPIVVKRGEALPSPDLTGDEPWMIRHRVPNCSLLVHRNRAVAAQESWSKLDSPHVVVMDDAFQHWKAFRDCDIVTVDATEGLDGMMLPFGRLREPPGALNRADLVVITRAAALSAPELANLKRQIREYALEPKLKPWRKQNPTKLRIVAVDYEFDSFLDLEGNPTAAPKEKKFVLAAGVAKPVIPAASICWR